MLVEVEENDSNVTYAFDDNAFNVFFASFKLLLQHYLQGNPLEEVNVEIFIVTCMSTHRKSLPCTANIKLNKICSGDIRHMHTCIGLSLIHI